MKTHVLKVWPCYYLPIVDGIKKFDFRKNDRDFQVGDELILKEYDPALREYSGRECRARVDFILQDGLIGLPAGYCCMSIHLLRPEPIGELFTLEEFSQLCKQGSVSDMDGSGRYAGTNFPALPSDFVAGNIFSQYSAIVIWFNK